MAPPYYIQFVDTALFNSNHFALSYPDDKQRWLIRKHLLSLIQDYPSFSPSADTFIHNDGTTVNLLNASGDLHVSSHTPPIHLTIWLHENYPFMPPIVFVSSNSASPIRCDHPFVDRCGTTSTAYLITWSFPGYNLSCLVHNLGKLFSHDHPFTNLPRPASSCFAHPSFVSKMEALDRLSGMIHYDMMALKSQAKEDREDLMRTRAELVNRKDVAARIVKELENEKVSLEDRVAMVRHETDELVNWLQVKNANLGDDEDAEDIVAYEGIDEESRVVIDCWAGSKAVEDMIYVLDETVLQERMSFDGYIRQVRGLYREQFRCIDTLVKLRGSDVLCNLSCD